MKLRDVEVNGDLTTEYYTGDDGKLTINIKQDVADILKANKDIASDTSLHKSSDLWHVASIPMTVVLEWRKLGIDVYKKADWPKIKKLLNSNEYMYLRTGGGQI